MVVLQIEHGVPDFNRWKKAFDSDPIDRKGCGVRRYTIFREVNSPDYVIVELAFDNIANAEATLSALKKLWNQVEGTVIMSPKARIIESFESMEY